MEKKKVVISREDLIKHIARTCKYYQSSVREVWDATEEYIYTSIATLPEDEELVIKLFNGIRIEAEVVPSKDKYVPYAGRNYEVSEQVKFKVKFSRYIKEKINNMRDLINYKFEDKQEEMENGKSNDDCNRGAEYSEITEQENR